MWLQVCFEVENVWDRRRSTGRLFQARKTPSLVALHNPGYHSPVQTMCSNSLTMPWHFPDWQLPMVERHVAGTRTSAVDAERSRRCESTSDSGWINSDRYCGAAPFRQRCSAPERKVCTGCVQAHAATASSQAVVSRGHQPWRQSMTSYKKPITGYSSSHMPVITITGQPRNSVFISRV